MYRSSVTFLLSLKSESNTFSKLIDYITAGSYHEQIKAAVDNINYSFSFELLMHVRTFINFCYVGCKVTVSLSFKII